MIDNSFQQARESIASDPSTLGIPVISGERLALFSEPHIIYDREIDNSWIAGSSTNAIVGTWTGTAGGGQLVVGDTDNTETLLRVIPVQGTYINALRATKANESGRGLVGPWSYPHANYPLDFNGNDYYGNFNGTVTDVSFVTGKVESAGQFNGSTSRVELPAADTILTDSNSWTICAWMYALSIGSGIVDNRVVTVYRPGATSTGVTLAIGSASPRFTVQLRNAALSTVNIDAGAVATGAWYHYCVSYDGTTFRVYVNGSLAASQTETFAGIGSGNAQIGCFTPGSSVFNGYIDDVRFYNQVLTLEEVGRLYNGGSGVGPSWIDTSNNIIYLGSSGQVVWRAALGDNTFNSVIPNLDVDADRTNMVFGSTAFIEVSSDLSSWTALTNKVRNSISSSSTLYWRLRSETDNLTWQTKDDRNLEVPVVIRFLEV